MPKNVPVLVTGAGGFIGSHLAERLVDSGAKVRAFVHYNGSGTCGWLAESKARDQVEVMAGDICDPDCVTAAVQDVKLVFHLAALIAIPYSYRAPRSYVRTNVEGTLNVLQAARDAGVERVVHTSTSEVYGTAKHVPIEEDHPLQAQSPYAASKIAADKIAESFHHAFGLPVTTVRPFNTYGPRQSARAVIPTIITQALTGDAVHLGSLDPTRDLVYVDDTVDGFVRIATADGAIGEVIHLGTGRQISIGDLARMIVAMVGRDIPIVSEAQRLRPPQSEVRTLCASVDKAHRIAGWQPRHTLEEGLPRCIAWIKHNLEHYKPNTYAT